MYIIHGGQFWKHLLDNLPHPAAIPGETVGGGVEGFSVVTPSLTEIKVIIGLMFIFAENIYMDMKDCRIPIDLDQIDGLQRLSIINMQNHCIQNHFNFIRNNIQG